jgi:bisphosphoglycerate-independent phosphoglycerate mutase (AlkP superfamily)
LPPLAIVLHEFQGRRAASLPAAQYGSLRDISPTLLAILKLAEPKQMTDGDLRVAITK